MAGLQATPRDMAPPFAVPLMFPDVDVAVLVAETLGERGPEADRSPAQAAWPSFLAQVLRSAPRRVMPGR